MEFTWQRNEEGVKRLWGGGSIRIDTQNPANREHQKCFTFILQGWQLVFLLSITVYAVVISLALLFHSTLL